MNPAAPVTRMVFPVTARTLHQSAVPVRAGNQPLSAAVVAPGWEGAPEGRGEAGHSVTAESRNSWGNFVGGGAQRADDGDFATGDQKNAVVTERAQ